MAEIKRVKIQNIIETQIPEFLNYDNPLFKEFLSQYYLSLEYPSGIIDVAENIDSYKTIDKVFNQNEFYNKNNPCILSSELDSYSSVINVNHTIGFPEKYGLLKIDEEIITYTGITTTSFTGCIRGFSGLSENDSKEFIFSSTESVSHQKDSVVTNINLQFSSKLFEKFKYQFLPGFEGRDFVENLDIDSILIAAREFYKAKGTDLSFSILFNILFGKEASIINPSDYVAIPSSNEYLNTKNVLVEKIFGENVLNLKGKTIYQNNNGNLANASIYNVEYRIIDGKEFYEFYLDPETIVGEFKNY